MRKYHQAALAIISSISLIAVVLYRNEYIKLRHVLEVFDYFGRPIDPYARNCTNLLANIGANKTAVSEFAAEHFEDPITSWQRLTDEIYVYSAYAINEEIRAVSFAKAKLLKTLSCRVTYENEIESSNGEFSYKTIESSESIDVKDDESSSKGIYAAYDLRCRYKVGKKLVAGVTFSSNVDRYKTSSDVTLPVRRLDYRADDDKNEIAVCVAPSASRPMINTDIIDFVSFHNSLGIESFVVYDHGIAPRLNSIFKHIGKQSGTEFNFTYATIPWNFPFSRVSVDVARLVVQADCLYRMYNHVRLVVTLTWDDYIVMMYHRTIEKLFSDIDKTGLAAQRYKLSTSNFCLDRYEANSKPIVLTGGENENRPVYIDRSTESPDVFNDDVVKSREITRDVIVVNRYERNCNSSLVLDSVKDPYVGKFSRVIQNSPIYKLFHLYV